MKMSKQAALVLVLIVTSLLGGIAPALAQDGSVELADQEAVIESIQYTPAETTTP